MPCFIFLPEREKEHISVSEWISNSQLSNKTKLKNDLLQKHIHTALQTRLGSIKHDIQKGNSILTLMGLLKPEHR